MSRYRASEAGAARSHAHASGRRNEQSARRPECSPCCLLRFAFVDSVPPFVNLGGLRNLRSATGIILISALRKDISRAEVQPTGRAPGIRRPGFRCSAGQARHHQHSIRALHPAERADGDPLAGSRDADGSGQCLVSRRIQERGARADRFRAPVRARDVHRFRPRSLRTARQAHRGRRRNQQRDDLERSDDLLRDHPVELSRVGPVDRSRSHGVPPRHARSREAQRAARHREERAPSELRQPAVRSRPESCSRRQPIRRRIRIRGTSSAAWKTCRRRRKKT